MKARLNNLARRNLCHQLAAYPWRNEIGTIGYRDEEIVELVWTQGSQYYLPIYVELIPEAKL